MIRQISVSAIVCALFAISMTAYAQGRPAGAGNQGGGSRPAMSQQQDRSASMRQAADLRREQAKAKRQAQEQARLAAESAHTAGPPADPGGDHNFSEQARIDHPPAAVLPVEAGLQSGNSDNGEVDSHGTRRNVTGVAQRDPALRVVDNDDADEPDAD
jgi:hypothetical protein